MNYFRPSLLDKELPIEEKIRLGVYSETLRTNPAFVEAIRQMYLQYTIAEDNVTLENGGDAGKHRYHYSTMRSLLLDLTNILDGMVQESENLKYNKELEIDSEE